jgi:hypothetical protein
MQENPVKKETLPELLDRAEAEKQYLPAVPIQQLKSQVVLIQQIMRDVMDEGTHYGVIPGCGNKPTLLKAGAEKLMLTFRLGVDPEVYDLSKGDVIRYRIRAKIFSLDSLAVVGYGLGECSSAENKYKNKNSADVANTVLKMAKKRALVDGVMTVTAASDIFTQDIEDLDLKTTQHEPAKTYPRQAAPTYPLKSSGISLFQISDSEINQMLEMMDEMGYAPEKKELALQKAKLVGPKKALEGLQKQYEAFLDRQFKAQDVLIDALEKNEAEITGGINNEEKI